MAGSHRVGASASLAPNPNGLHGLHGQSDEATLVPAATRAAGSLEPAGGRLSGCRWRLGGVPVVSEWFSRVSESN